MTTQDLINTIKQGKPMTAALMREIVRELEEKTEQVRTIENIKIHFDKLCTDDLRQHGFVAHDHEIDFQVFRVLCGYKEALDELAALQAAAKFIIEECDWENDKRIAEALRKALEEKP